MDSTHPTDRSLNESPELIAQECTQITGRHQLTISLNESPELIAQEFASFSTLSQTRVEPQ